MKRLLVVLVLLAIGVAAFGLYRGWFSVGWESSNGKGQITGTVDEDKIRQDRDKAAEKVRDLRDRSKSKTATASEGSSPVGKE
jgi:hypothetical protein